MIKFAVGQGAAGLFLEPGLGKTSISLAIYKVLKKQRHVQSALVIAPLRVCHAVWPSEVSKWDDFKDLKVVVLHGPKKRQALREKADLYVINPEGLDWLATQRDLPFDMLIVDESTRFKRTNTQRYKKLESLMNSGRFKRRYILTGTPTPNGLMDLFGQIKILDGGAALGRYITHYRNKYFLPAGYGGYQWVLQEGADVLIHEAVKPLCVFLKATDCIDLPEEPLINPVYVDLPPKARKLYDAMEQELFITLGRREIAAVNSAAAAMKCRQIANGGLYTDDKAKTWKTVHEAKLEAVEEIVSELNGRPVLISYEFRHDLDRLRKRFGTEHPYIGTGTDAVKAKDTSELERAWNANEVPILFGQTGATSLGLNLQENDGALIMHSLTYNLEHYDQLIRRLWRQGRKTRVVVHMIIARDTTDEAMLAALRSKDKTQKSFLAALNAYAHRRPSDWLKKV